MINAFVIAALATTHATAPPPKCLTRQEAGDIALTAASIGLGAIAQRCRPHVGANAFLNQGAQAMLDRLNAAAQPRRNSAFLAFARISSPSPSAADGEGGTQGSGSEDQDEENSDDSDGSSFPQLNPSTNPELMGGLVAVMAAAAINSVDTAACPDANDFIENLSPLSPENIARLAGAGLGIAGTLRPSGADNPLCPQ